MSLTPGQSVFAPARMSVPTTGAAPAHPRPRAPAPARSRARGYDRDDMPPSRAPLDYYTTAVPTQEKRPRLSKLAISAFTVSIVSALLMCGPILPFIRNVVPNGLQWLALVSIPALTLLLSITALVRILRSLDDLRGEGIAIAGMVTSMVTGLVVLMIVSLP